MNILYEWIWKKRKHNHIGNSDTPVVVVYWILIFIIDTTPGSGPDFSQASFDLSSFIGGIILVLVLQAGAFFAMRFLKTKDSSYETMWVIIIY